MNAESIDFDINTTFSEFGYGRSFSRRSGLVEETESHVVVRLLFLFSLLLDFFLSCRKLVFAQFREYRKNDKQYVPAAGAPPAAAAPPDDEAAAPPDGTDPSFCDPSAIKSSIDFPFTSERRDSIRESSASIPTVDKRDVISDATKFVRNMLHRSIVLR